MKKVENKGENFLYIQKEIENILKINTIILDLIQKNLQKKRELKKTWSLFPKMKKNYLF